MEKVIIASNNMNKIREFSEMLGKDVQVLSLHDVGFDSEIDEKRRNLFRQRAYQGKNDKPVPSRKRNIRARLRRRQRTVGKRP